MIPADYFDRPDTPAKNSPVGKLMQKIHSRFPHLDLETIRIEAREALLGIGGATRIQDAYKRWLITRSGASMTRKARLALAGRANTPRGADSSPKDHSFRDCVFNERNIECEPRSV
ncbi:MAG TPA: hypothetical protein VEJ45_10740 [Candidatus Acidoferrales bacterium]|nr:hypothetical protein [Candidatus Acidoferrales bacterium]